MTQSRSTHPSSRVSHKPLETETLSSALSFASLLPLNTADPSPSLSPPLSHSTASQYAIPLDALPINLNGYLMEEETIGKLCHMVPGDAVLVFQNFMVRFHEIVSLSHLPLPKSTELSQDQVRPSSIKSHSNFNPKTLNSPDLIVIYFRPHPLKPLALSPSPSPSPSHPLPLSTHPLPLTPLMIISGPGCPTAASAYISHQRSPKASPLLHLNNPRPPSSHLLSPLSFSSLHSDRIFLPPP